MAKYGIKRSALHRLSAVCEEYSPVIDSSRLILPLPLRCLGNSRVRQTEIRAQGKLVDTEPRSKSKLRGERFMRPRIPSTRSALTLTIVALTLTSLATPRYASSQTETVIHAFQSTEKYDGFSPNANLIADANGALYGTTATGGQHGWGTVFKLTPPSSGGGWTESILYSFTGLNDGGQPSGGTLLLKGGSLYGTTSEGGVNGVGVVFELSPGKPWVETVLYAFTTSGGGGFTPSSGLTQGSKGTYYGTTFKGGAHKQGVVYRLSPPTGGGSWTEAPIYAFKGGSTDGYEPGDNLTIDSTGSLHGVTLGYPGTAFKLTPSGTGA